MQRQQEPICLDASVLINVLASGIPAEILAATRWHPIYIEDRAWREVARQASRLEALENLKRAKSITRIRVAGSAEELLIDLVAADVPDDFGDAEAGVVAVAVSEACAAATDDGKTRRICARQFKQVPLVWSIEIFRQAIISDALPPEAAIAGLFTALRDVRMAVPNEFLGWARKQLGERAVEIAVLR